jgi:hypothetical protein
MEIADCEYGLFPRMHIPAGEGGGINGLLKKGLIEWHKRTFLKVTPLGAEVVAALREAASKAREQGAV